MPAAQYTKAPSSSRAQTHVPEDRQAGAPKASACCKPQPWSWPQPGSHLLPEPCHSRFHVGIGVAVGIHCGQVGAADDAHQEALLL